MKRNFCNKGDYMAKIQCPSFTGIFYFGNPLWPRFGKIFLLDHYRVGKNIFYMPNSSYPNVGIWFGEGNRKHKT